MEIALTRTRSDQLNNVQKFKDNKQDEKSQHSSKITHHQHHNYNTSIIDQNINKKRKVAPVVYYLSRNGQLEHPHFMEVPLSSPHGLFLRDVILRFNLLRGKSLASHYSWSSKRSYKNGYVWHDLEENDFIHPVHGGEYVLKGSEIQLETTVSSLTISKPSETSSSKTTPVAGELDFPASVTRTRRRNQSWGSLDLHEYKVYKTESTHEFNGKAAADASTQTDEKRRRRSKLVIKEEGEEEEVNGQRREKVEEIQQSTELSRDEISPPPSDSSPETLESLMKADGRLIIASSQAGVDQGGDNINQTVGGCPSGRMKASSVFMSLISCGSVSFRDCGVATVKDHGFSLISHYKNRLPRGEHQTVDGEMSMIEIENNVSSKFAKMALEDKEYFSGSLIETNKKDEFSSSMLKRSSSYNADRSSHLKLEEEQEAGVRAKCIPRRPRAQPSTSKKECDTEITSVTINTTRERN